MIYLYDSFIYGTKTQWKPFIDLCQRFTERMGGDSSVVSEAVHVHLTILADFRFRGFPDFKIFCLATVLHELKIYKPA